MSAETSVPMDPPISALVLAASRGPEDPVARSEGVTHKCLVDVAGVPMLARVLEALQASPSVEGIAISIDDAGVLDALPTVTAAVEAGALTLLKSADTPSGSVLAAARAVERYPLLITTADNPLLTPDMVEHFCRAARQAAADVVAGVVAHVEALVEDGELVAGLDAAFSPDGEQLIAGVVLWDVVRQRPRSRPATTAPSRSGS